MFDREALIIGISLNSEEAFKKVIKGPSSENKDEVLVFHNSFLYKPVCPWINVLIHIHGHYRLQNLKLFGEKKQSCEILMVLLNVQVS